MKSITVFILISAFLIVTIAAFVSTVSGESEPSRNGDGVIYMYHDLVVSAGEEEAFEDETIVLAGNVYVEGTLILRNTSLLMDSSYNGDRGINVLPGGDLRVIDGSRIEPEGEKHYTFVVSRENKEHGNLVITDSTISGAGYHSTVLEHNGIFIESAKVTITRSEFIDNHIGLYFHHVRGDVLIEGSMFRGNDQSIVMDSSSGLTIAGNEFLNNDRAVDITMSDIITLMGNTFRDNDHAVVMDNSTEFVIQNNVLTGNARSGLNIESSFDGVIQGNEITETRSQERNVLGSGILLRTNSMVSISENLLQNNDIGIMMIINNTGVVLENTTIKGGQLGLYLYNEQYTNEYRALRITDTREAAINMKHSSSQVFDAITLTSNQALGLNVTASSGTFNYPEFEIIDHSVDPKSDVRLIGRTMIRVSELNGVPLPESEVSVMIDGEIIYSTEKYGGNDPVTDNMGMTGSIPLEYIIMDHRGTHQCRIEISVSWNGIELTRTTFGVIASVERFNLNIPDLTVSDNEMVLIPSELYEANEPSNDDSLRVGTSITNLGTADIDTEVSLYHVPGIWSGDVDVHIEDFEIPFNANHIETSPITVEALETKYIESSWVPGFAGEHTLLSIIDEDQRSLELRKDNNIAYIHVTVMKSEIQPLEHANISLEIPGLTNGSEVNTTMLNLMPILRNDGTLRGTVVLRATLHQADQTIQFFNDIYSVGPDRDLRIQLLVDLELGDAILNFTLFQQVGEDTIEILTPFVSFSFTVVEGEGPGFDTKEENKPLIPGVLLYSSTAGTVAFFVAYIAFAESARYRFLLFFVPLYMRMSKKDITEQYTRGEIIGYIKQNPGESYNNIKRDLEMSNGKLAYHLSVLEKGGFVKSVTDGMYRRYYPRKAKVTTYGRITSVQEEILRRIEETPGITQKDLSKLVDLSTATINYHIRKLTGKGLITTKRTGIFIHYYLDGLSVEEIMTNAISSKNRATVKQ